MTKKEESGQMPAEKTGKKTAKDTASELTLQGISGSVKAVVKKVRVKKAATEELATESVSNSTSESKKVSKSEKPSSSKSVESETVKLTEAKPPKKLASGNQAKAQVEAQKKATKTKAATTEKKAESDKKDAKKDTKKTTTARKSQRTDKAVSSKAKEKVVADVLPLTSDPSGFVPRKLSQEELKRRDEEKRQKEAALQLERQKKLQAEAKALAEKEAKEREAADKAQRERLKEALNRKDTEQKRKVEEQRKKAAARQEAEHIGIPQFGRKIASAKDLKVQVTQNKEAQPSSKPTTASSKKSSSQEKSVNAHSIVTSVPEKKDILPNVPSGIGRKIGKKVDVAAMNAQASASSSRGGRGRGRSEGGQGRFSGGRSFGSGPNTGGRSFGGQGRGRSDNRKPNHSDPDHYNPYAKDEDEKPKFRSAPRRAQTKTQPVLDLGRSTRSNYASRQQNQNRDKNRSNAFKEDGRFGGRNSKMRNNFFEDERMNGRRRRKKSGTQTQVQVRTLTNVQLPAQLTVKELAEGLQKTVGDVIVKLMGLGMMATANDVLDYESAALLASEYNIDATQLVEVTAEDILFDDAQDNPEALKVRPPVVVVMGHVDHGKTTLLDYIRSAHVVAGEAGGITQHIGAYMVELQGDSDINVTGEDRNITFLDTPGHEAFITMRARGAEATDIAILVVAADDGVMPQTIEAINHAKAADIPIIVAINKMDKHTANPTRVMQELATHGLQSEEWGGDTVMVPISAKTGEGVDNLLEMVLLTADVQELQADPTRQAKGVVLEAELDPQRGPVASLLVQRGTLRLRDTLFSDTVTGTIRAMFDARGNAIEEAGPSVPVKVLGFSEVPQAGKDFYVVEDERMAKQLADKRKDEAHQAHINRRSKVTLDTLFDRIGEGSVQELNVIIKGDVVGSVEAVRQSLERLNTKVEDASIRLNVIHGAAGAVTESDVNLAQVANAIIVGFNVRPANKVEELAKEAGVDIRLYRVIYQASEDIEKAMKGLLAPEFKEEILGHAEIREIFVVSKVGTIGGAYVIDGKIGRNNKIRLVRDGIVKMEGSLASLRRFKDDVSVVATGYECGISIEAYNDIKPGDIIEAYEMKEIPRV